MTYNDFRQGAVNHVGPTTKPLLRGVTVSIPKSLDLCKGKVKASEQNLNETPGGSNTRCSTKPQADQLQPSILDPLRRSSCVSRLGSSPATNLSKERCLFCTSSMNLLLSGCQQRCRCRTRACCPPPSSPPPASSTPPTGRRPWWRPPRPPQPGRPPPSSASLLHRLLSQLLPGIMMAAEQILSLQPEHWVDSATL